MPRELQSYCADVVKRCAYPYYIATFFVPAEKREACFALLAWHAEIARIPKLVSEPMLGHIRFAWWREALDALFSAETGYTHPVLEALAPVIAEGMVKKEDLDAFTDACENILEENMPQTCPAHRQQAMLGLLAGVAGAPPDTERPPKWWRAYKAAGECPLENETHPGNKGWLSLLTLWKISMA